jgi:hypothetical protein
VRRVETFEIQPPRLFTVVLLLKNGFQRRIFFVAKTLLPQPESPAQSFRNEQRGGLSAAVYLGLPK